MLMDCFQNYIYPRKCVSTSRKIICESVSEEIFFDNELSPSQRDKDICLINIKY